MRKISVDDLKVNMIVARTIFSSDGRALLLAGVSLNETYIKRLENLGIQSIYIKDGLIDDIEIPELISDQTRLETIKIVKDNFRMLKNDRKLDTHAVQKSVDNIIDELFSNRFVLLHLSEIWTFDDYTFAHSLNVCILSIMTGITLGYNDTKLKEIGIGSLLHDIGKTKINEEILNKYDDLSNSEYDEIKKHAEYGFEILRKYDDISLLSAHIAFQHHERWDGQGYPRGLKGNDIHEYARLVAVADVYDALMAERPYRPPYSVNQAINIIKRMSGIHLDPICVSALISNIAIYPIGSILELSTGQIAVVVDVNRESLSRPIVKVVFGSNHKQLNNAHEIDLSKMSTILIKRSLNDKEITQIINSN